MFTHIDENNNPTMVDVSQKSETTRLAQARCQIYLPDEIVENYDGTEIKTKKGCVFQTAIIAGTMAVKQTHNLIPFCHPLNIESIKIYINEKDKNNFTIDCFVKNTGKTGVEMEALMGANVCALTIYDMCKAMSQKMIISDLMLMKKSGGKTDYEAKDE